MIDVDNVCTHADLGDHVGLTALEGVLPAEWGGSSEPARAGALRDVLKSLGRRTPPVGEADLQDPTELRDAVAYGALERIFRQAMTTPDSVWSTQRKVFDERFKSEMLGLQVTVASSQRAHPGLGIPMVRR